MNVETQADDIGAIEALIARQFSSLSWTAETPPDWTAFAADFATDAALYPSARPARRQTLDAFIARMKGLTDTELRSFDERVLGTEIRVFGNVAIALAACEAIENGLDATRSVEMMLLVKTGGAWRIVSQAWDREDAEKRIPPHLIRPLAAR